MILKLGLEKKKNIGYNILSSLQIWFIGRTLASQAGETGSIPAICFFIAMKYLRVNTNPYCSGMKNAISIDYKEVDKTIGIPCKRCTNKNIL